MSDTIFYCLVNCNCKPQLQAAPQHNRHGVIFTPTYAHTELDEYHIIICELLPAVRIFLLQRSCQPSVASSVTPPCIKKYIRGQDPVMLHARAFIELYC